MFNWGIHQGIVQFLPMPLIKQEGYSSLEMAKISLLPLFTEEIKTGIQFFTTHFYLMYFNGINFI